MRLHFAGDLALLLSLTTIASSAQADSAQERHRFPISVSVEAPADATRNGPLFKTVNDLSYSTSEKAWADALSPKAEVSLRSKDAALTYGQAIDKFIHVLLKNCQGPYAIDEGRSWVQTSWVCHIGHNEPIRDYFSFKDSPELSLEFGFDSGKIKYISAMELIPLPPKFSHLRMDAAETIPDKR